MTNYEHIFETLAEEYAQLSDDDDQQQVCVYGGRLLSQYARQYACHDRYDGIKVTVQRLPDESVYRDGVTVLYIKNTKYILSGDYYSKYPASFSLRAYNSVPESEITLEDMRQFTHEFSDFMQQSYDE